VPGSIILGGAAIESYSDVGEARFYACPIGVASGAKWMGRLLRWRLHIKDSNARLTDFVSKPSAALWDALGIVQAEVGTIQRAEVEESRKRDAINAKLRGAG